MTDVPANDLDAEAAVLSAMLLDNGNIDEVATVLTPEHFYADANRRICEAIYGLRSGGHPADIVLVADWLRNHDRLAQVGGATYLAQIVDATPVTGNVVEHASVVRDKWRVRQLTNLAIEARSLSYGPVEDPQALLESFEQRIADVAHLGRTVTLEPVWKIANREIERLIEAREHGGPLSGISTGFADLDRQTGGLFTGDLTIVAARPGLGKTAFVTSLACNLARPKRDEAGAVIEPGEGVAFFTLEISREQLAMRIACHEAELDFSLIRKNMISREGWTKLLDAADTLRDMPIWIDDSPGISLFEARARIRKLKREMESGRAPIPSRGLKLGVFDYLQLMKGDRPKGASREQEVASLSRGAKELAKQEELALIAVSQLNRYLERHTKDKRPGLSDLRESGALEQDADNVLFLYRESYYDRSTQDKNAAELDVAKQRNGPTGVIPIYFSPHAMRFYNAVAGSYNFDDFGAEPG